MKALFYSLANKQNHRKKGLIAPITAADPHNNLDGTTTTGRFDIDGLWRLFDRVGFEEKKHVCFVEKKN